MLMRSLHTPLIGSLALVTMAASTQAALPEQNKQQVPGYFRMMVDDHEVTALYDGYIELPTQLLKGMEDTEIREHLDRLFIDAGSGVQTAVNAFLIHTGEHLVMVDAGSAACFGPTLGQVEANLRASGYMPEDVDTILMTHLHPDHVCGLTNADGERIYPNAEVRVSQQDAEFWLNEEHAAQAPEDKRPFFDMARKAVGPYQQADQFSTFEPGDELLTYLVAKDTRGHTPGHVSFMLTGDAERMLVWGDIMHSYGVQLADPTVAIEFDSDPERAIASRQEVLDDAAEEKHWVAGAHMPFPGIGHVARHGAREGEQSYRWVPIGYGPIRDDQ